MNIWWNHWFSTAYHLIQLMREASVPLHVIGSNSNPDCVYKMVCDEWYSEPYGMGTEEYVSFCLNFCKQHQIDIFVPRHNLTALIQQAAVFQKNGTLLLANTNLEEVRLVDDKVATYHYLKSKGLQEWIPEFYACNQASEFIQAVSTLQEKGYRVCYKLAFDEGATTYHVIEEHKPLSIRKTSSSHVSMQQSLELVAHYTFSIPILVMPYLEEPEISVDCLKTDSDWILIPRYKLGGRVSEIRWDTTILEMAKKISEQFSFTMPYNIQFRMLYGKPMLLEINPRMSGGLQLSWRGSGINLPAFALMKLLGKSLPRVPLMRKNQKVAHIETPILIE